MRRSAWHLKDASSAILRARSARLSCTPSCNWDSHLRALLRAFDTPWTQHSRRRHYHQSTIPTTTCSSHCRNSNDCHSPLFSPRYFSSIVLTTSEQQQQQQQQQQLQQQQQQKRSWTRQRGENPAPLPEPLSVFNLSCKLELADLERAIALRKADSAWSIFSTLSSGQYIPLPLCASLYSVLTFAKTLAEKESTSSYRQGQINELCEYVESTFEIPRTQFSTMAEVIPVPTHKLLLRAVRYGHIRTSWLIYRGIEKDVEILPRSTVLQLMSLVQRDIRINSFERKRRMDYIARRHEGVEENGRALTAEELLNIGKVYYHFDLGDVRTAHGLMMMQAPTISPNALAELVWRAVEFKALKPAWDLVRAIERPEQLHEMAFANLISAYRKKKNYTQALEIFEDMLKRGLKPSVRSFNEVIHVYADKGLVDKADAMLNAMQELQIPADIATYGLMIRAKAESGDMRSAIQCYFSMQKQGVEPNVYIFGLFINAFAQKSDIHSVLRWFSSMLKRQIPVNEVIATSVLKAFRTRRKRLMNEAIISISDHVLASGIKVNTVLYTILLMVKADLSGLAGALSVHREMLARCIEPNTYTYTVLMHVCGAYKAPDLALQIFDLMKRSRDHRPDTITYIAMMDVWLKARQVDKAREVLKEFMSESKKDPDRLWMDDRVHHYICTLDGHP
ncbi:hypothetical protein BX666DRAFT_1966767 [Dichotomocladium elegans]|nr:hypothetical protein BX666DRAFT_1966767 [Dichotomocladium elegans]